MPRVKTNNLFNKNHIIVTKTENINVSEPYAELTYGGKSDTVYYFDTRARRKPRYERRRFESPLGFYYWKDVIVEPGGNKPSHTKSFFTNEVYLCFKTYKYKITYVHTNEGNSIGPELRPWEIIDGSMNDHFVTDLLNLLERLFQEARDSKLQVKRYDTHEHKYKIDRMTIGELRNKVFTDIFGSPKGIRYQTNEEKILSHGFDLKTSFRKV
jgi:hypothetical protein